MLSAFPSTFSWSESWYSQQQLDGLQMQTANENPLAAQVWGFVGLSRVLSWANQLSAEALERQFFTHAWSRK